MPPRYYGYKKPSTANAKPTTTTPIVATGQWQPGALSQADTRTTTQSVADRNVTHFTDLGGGKTGSLVDQPVTDLSQMTPAFAAKAQQALAQEALSQQQGIPQAAPASATAGAAPNPFAPNANNPFAPNFSGTPPQTGFEQTMSMNDTGAEGGAQQQPTIPQRIYQRFAQDIYATTGITLPGYAPPAGVENESISLSAGMAGFAAGATDSWVISSLKKTAAGVITKEGLKTGGVKSSQTIMNGLTKAFKPSQAYTSIKAVMVGMGILYFIHSIIKDSTSTGGMGTRDVGEEGGGAVATACRDFFVRKDYVGYEQCKQVWNDVKNTSASWAPYGVGAVKNVMTYQDIVDTNFKMYDEHLARMQELGGSELMSMADGSNMSPVETADFWARYHASVNLAEEESKKKATDYDNSEYLRVTAEVAAARAKANSSERAADKKAAEDLAAFWLDYQKKLAALEEESMQKQAKFWLDYRKMVIKIQEETGRSRLGFGLFR